jgi:3-hydroxybutyryl-CoA dehydrogenase
VADKTPIQTVAVLGAGTMGHGIAHAAMSAGYDTVLYDVSQAAVDKGKAAIDSVISKSVQLGKASDADAEAMRRRLRLATVVADAVKNADVVIEAAPEKIDLKLALFKEVEAAAPVHAVFASNTSALSITEMAAVLDNPGRLGGMHFFNPVHRMKLIEVVRALDTTPETIAVMEEVAAKMGKETVLVKESPGFITTRINAMIGNEAFNMLQEGVASARDIDKALKGVKARAQSPDGPLRAG